MNFLYLILCLIIALIPALLLYRQDKKRQIKHYWLPAGLRFLTILSTALLLLAPTFPQSKQLEEKLNIVWLQDQSTSMKRALGDDSLLYKKKVESLLKESSSSFQLIPIAFGHQLTRGINFQYQSPITNIGGALQKVQSRYKDQNLGAIILASDGNYNEGSNPRYLLSEDKKVPIFTIALGDSTTPRDLSITFARANKTALLGNQFEVIANVKAQKLSGKTGRLQVLHGGKQIAGESFNITGNDYNRSFRFYLDASQKGLQKYSLVLPVEEGEQNTNNNRRDLFVEVLEKKVNILVAAAAPHPDIAAIQAAIKEQPEYKMTVKYGSEIPASIEDFDLLITHDLPHNKGFKIPQHSGIPGWYILGSQTNDAAFNTQQGMATKGSGSSPSNALPTLNEHFAYLPLPGNIRALVPSLPPLHQHSGRLSIKEGSALFNRTGESGTAPSALWAIKTSPNPAAILDGTGLWRWRAYAFRKDKAQVQALDQLIIQTINLLATQIDRKPFQISLEKMAFQDQESITIGATLKDPGGNLTNTPEAKYNLRDAAGVDRKSNFSRVGKSYQTVLHQLPAGSYTLSGEVVLNGKTYSDVVHFSVSTLSIEDLKQHSDFDILYQLAQDSKGKFYELSTIDQLLQDLKSDSRLKSVLKEEVHYIKLIDLKWFFLIPLFLASAEWFYRKYKG